MELNSGIDMVMLPTVTDIVSMFFTDAKWCLDEGEVSIGRIDDAVKRILRVKLAMDLVKLTGKEYQKKQIEKPDWVSTAAEDALKAA
mmetsp:Transcript_11805/g.5941  ORF Transcript_11805/g.5941 Transcript_11805/m.5941 type:complete len:87 (+) Transcript_11805:312-572(+)